MPASIPIKLHDFEPSLGDFREEVIAGLSKQPQKTLPCKFFYDERGSKIFDQICELDEYYPTRTEMGIMQESIEEMVEFIGPQALLIEYGSGSSLKTRLLLEHLRDPAGYVPLDISREHLLNAAESINSEFPSIDVYPICADYLQDFDVPEVRKPVRARRAYFPGSTIGNFTPSMAETFMKRVRKLVGDDGGLLIGVDLRKSPDVLVAAYSDSEGVTSEFNMNLLSRINNELGGDFDLDKFHHEARWNDELGRMESYIVSDADQTVTINGEPFEFKKGEDVHTENSHKYRIDEFAEFASKAGFEVEKVWTDPKKYFSIQYLSAK